MSLFGVRETHLPGFEGATGWLNSEPLRSDDLRGKHTPEFPFERDVENIREAVKDLRVEYPVAIDSDYRVWDAYVVLAADQRQTAVEPVREDIKVGPRCQRSRLPMATPMLRIPRPQAPLLGRAMELASI